MCSSDLGQQATAEGIFAAVRVDGLEEIGREAVAETGGGGIPGAGRGVEDGHAVIAAGEVDGHNLGVVGLAKGPDGLGVRHEEVGLGEEHLEVDGVGTKLVDGVEVDGHEDAGFAAADAGAEGADGSEREFAQLDQDPFAGIDAVATSDAVASLERVATLGGSTQRDAFRPGVADFYLTNPITRASRVLAECSGLARSRGLEAAE